MSAFDLAFLSNRGLYIPSPQLGDGFIAFILAVVMAIVLSVGLFRFNKTYQIKTGQLRRTWPIAAVLIIGLPLLAQWLLAQHYTGMSQPYEALTSAAGWF